MQIRTLLLGLFLTTCPLSFVYGQETVSFMCYNLLNFPDQAPNRADTLKKIIQHKQPDVFLICELSTSFGRSIITSQAMNVDGVTYYGAAAWNDGYDSDNMLWYNTNKLGLKSQTQIQTNLRDISEYVLYYKSSDIATNPDTIFITVYGVHLKAGSSQSNEDDREDEAQVLKNRLAITNPENVLVGGDFNMKTYLEPAYAKLTVGGTVPLFDPINRAGSWNNNANFADVHTQSTRTTSLNGGSTGGLDDRFDMWFIGSQVKDGTDGVQYISGSYEAVGNDANHFNDDINDMPNTAVSPDIANALYYMSDHLPVYMELLVGRNVSVPEISREKWSVTRFEDNYLHVFTESETEDVSLTLIDLNGNIILSESHAQFKEGFLPLPSDLSKGIYILDIQTSDTRVPLKVGLF